MRRTKLGFSVPKLMLAAVVGYVSLGSAVAETFTKEIDVAPGEALRIDLETGGAVTIVGWDRDVFSLRAEMDGDTRDVDLRVLKDSGAVIVRTVFETRSRSRYFDAHFEIRVPRRFDVDVRTTGGGIAIADLEGAIGGATSGGALALRGIRGTLDLETKGGGIDLEDSDVGGRVVTYGGNVRVRNVGGTVEVNTLGGNVVFDNVRPGAGASGGEPEVKVSTHGGNIIVPDAPFGADLETNGGNIVVEQAAGYVRAKTKGGNIDIRAVDGWVRATTFGGNITVVMVGDPAGGKRDVRLESKGGDISLTVPEGLSMDVDVTIGYTKSSRQNFGIRSDFPLEIRRSDTWDYGGSAPRKYIYGTGTFGGGGNRIKIETVNGDVRLIEER